MRRRSSSYGVPSDGGGGCAALEGLAERYMRWASSGRYAESTVRARRRYLRHFTRWLSRDGITSLGRAPAESLERYRAVICGLRLPSGGRIGTGAVTQRLLAIRGFLRWCGARGHPVPRWGDALSLPRREYTLPPRVLSAAEAEVLLAQPDVSTLLGLRDRATLEILYAAGLRRAEVAALTLRDIDHGRALVWIRRGKGGRDRVVPLGSRALRWIEQYLEHARPHLARNAQSPWLLLTQRGRRWQPKHLGERVGRYVRSSGLATRGSCHILRHSMATLMFERGADIRALQAMLGHARISTTEIYTRVGIAHLCEVHARTHPAERDAGVCEARRNVTSVATECDGSCGRSWNV